MKPLTYEQFKVRVSHITHGIIAHTITNEAAALSLLAYLGNVREEDISLAIGYAQGLTGAR